MALERSSELEQAHGDLVEAYNRRDAAAMARLVSDHPATVARGTAPDEVLKSKDEMMAGFAASIGEFPRLTSFDVEAYADGDIGYVYADNTFTTPDGTEFPSRSLSVCRREEGQWRFLHALSAIPVPNEMLTPDSPFARARATT